MGRKKFFYRIVFVLLAAGLIIISRVPVLCAMGQFLVIRDKVQTADVIVVLGGDDGPRVARAAALYKQGLAPFVIMSGRSADPSDAMALKMKARAVLLGVPAHRILLEPRSAHTYQHPVFVKPIMQRHGFRSAIVVSSPYHMRRVAVVFDRVFFGSGIRLMYCPVQESWFDPDRWWADAASRQAVRSEYLKMIPNMMGTPVNDFLVSLRKY